jgi:hypothetical protein
MHSPPSNWGTPILWGHDRKGPFTIIEGNHRLVAYASQANKSGLSVPVFVGLSKTPCFWHIFAMHPTSSWMIFGGDCDLSPDDILRREYRSHPAISGIILLQTAATQLFRRDPGDRTSGGRRGLCSSAMATRRSRKAPPRGCGGGIAWRVPRRPISTGRQLWLGCRAHRRCVRYQGT